MNNYKSTYVTRVGINKQCVVQSITALFIN